MTLADMATSLGGGPADIPGLWWIPGYPELTTNQLQSVFVSRAVHANQPTISDVAHILAGNCGGR